MPANNRRADFPTCLHMYKGGYGRAQIALRLKVTTRTVERWLKEYFGSSFGGFRQQRAPNGVSGHRPDHYTLSLPGGASTLLQDVPLSEMQTTPFINDLSFFARDRRTRKAGQTEGDKNNAVGL